MGRTDYNITLQRVCTFLLIPITYRSPLHTVRELEEAVKNFNGRQKLADALHQVSAVTFSLIRKSAWHTDVEKTKDRWTSVFYYNTNNGGTEFKDEGFIKSEANTLVTFPASLEHRSVQQTDATFRYVLNLNYDLRK